MLSASGSVGVIWVGKQKVRVPRTGVNLFLKADPTALAQVAGVSLARARAVGAKKWLEIPVARALPAYLDLLDPSSGFGVSGTPSMWGASTYRGAATVTVGGTSTALLIRAVGTSLPQAVLLPNATKPLPVLRCGVPNVHPAAMLPGKVVVR